MIKTRTPIHKTRKSILIQPSNNVKRANAFQQDKTFKNFESKQF